jgi:hypothetical protein
MMRDYDPAVGRYVESDPIGQRLYFSLSNISGVSQRHRGYWNHLYNYGDNLPTMIRDPSGMGELFDWLWDLFKEKTPEAVATKGLAVGFGTLCITKNCGKSRDWVDLYADCASILNDWMKRAGAVGTGAVSGITGDGGQAVISECADLCEKGIKSSSCCNGVKQ